MLTNPRKASHARTLGGLADDELLAAAGPGATLEVDNDPEPPFATSAWRGWMDRRYPPKPDEWFYAIARRARERSQAHTATAKEWAALREWRRFRAEYLARPNPAWKPQEENL